MVFRYASLGRTIFASVKVRSLIYIQGDFNLAALDLLPEAGLYWVGNCNELNAGKIPASTD